MVAQRGREWEREKRDRRGREVESGNEGKIGISCEIHFDANKNTLEVLLM